MSDLNSFSSYHNFAKFEGIEGEAKTEKYENWISVIHVDCSISNPSNGSIGDTGSLGTGKGILNHFVVHINFDKAICALQKYVITGKHIGKTEIHMLRFIGDDKPSVWCKYTLTNTYIYEVTNGNPSDNFIMINLRMKKLQIDFTPADNKGAALATSSLTWNLEKNILE
ncbi:type VI secretion system tube protein Hcp [Xenorhabdus bovienii]|uniref:Putative secretion system effector of SST VI cluster (Hcp family) n=1 Tax=Xenorhabdus bovienii str. Intermedium TaxID=1379677 RepID=A0A077QLY1_XENBV|nr:type VI secretion system tube protein Hcp [Xenorhabdus bovienii]MDE9455355.1 type VI secretion system tube protein Hcp [Xenorhabdus bovienii]MDE9483389.1 type VI secretion system tube protein Hcp [Xenorhabdus bovienii]MDE9544658.1 type VI secretion system tube protein Hcp [Xenorhabdus bovienii]MDE9552829.1 type VI secretion system tube protein Hcp [Xenorhabdus bovienii]MDE9557392.1 type VI secretion system tube protein Hcp [Xenorhabdus bovienii]